MKRILYLFLTLVLFVACKGESTSQEKDKTLANEMESKDMDQSQGSDEDANNRDKKGGEINISAAASLQYSLEEITNKYSQVHGVNFNLNFGGSGALREQIEAGAQADLFISANSKHMQILVDKAYIDEESLVDLLINDVVLIVPKANEAGVKSFEDLTKDSVKVVAQGEPSSVPVGEYSQEILSYYGIADEVNSKASLATDVTQVLNWVDGGEADAGIVYKTDSMQKDKIEVIMAAPKDSHKPVTYPAALLKEAKNKGAAKEFLDYLQGQEAREIFEKYGFGV